MCCAPNYPRAFYPRRHVLIPEVDEVWVVTMCT
jgi:hypothetical protein